MLTNNIVKSNNEAGHFIGCIFLVHSSNNLFTNNNVLNNNCGIDLDSSSNYNIIYHNDFIDNGKSAFDRSGTNIWDCGYPSGGNYWSDYDEKSEGAVDKKRGPNQDLPGSDGIVDTPYKIPGDAGAKDIFPLIKPVTSAVFIEIEISKYKIKKDCDDPFKFGVADPYFLIDVEGIDGTFRSPEEDNEPSVDQVGKGYPGPLYIPNSPVSLPAEITIKAIDSDPGHDQELDTYSFILSSLPQAKSSDKGENIYFDVMVREVPATPLDMTTGGTNDPENLLQWYWYQVGANQVWQDEHYRNKLTSEESEIIVAVLDTGVDYNHRDLDDNVDDWRGYDFLDKDPNPMDEGNDKGKYHGTKLAGIIAAEINNDHEGIAGIAPNVKIMPLRVRRSGWETLVKGYEIAKAIRYAVDRGAKVISMSFGGDTFPLGAEAEIRDAIEYAYNKNVILVGSAGNSKTPKAIYPAALDRVISVSALERIPYGNVVPWDGDYLIFADGFSNYGPSLTNRKESVELSAPGWKMRTTFCPKEGRGKYYYAQGTSFSCPVVSAIAAMVLGYAKSEYDRELTPDDVRNILSESATDLGAPGWDPYYGYGMVNAYQALQKVDEDMPPICVKGGNENYRPLKVFFRGSQIHVKILKPLPPGVFTYTLMRKQPPEDEEIARKTTASYDFDMDMPSDAPIGEYYIKIEGTEIQSEEFYIIFNPEACVPPEFSQTDLSDYWSSEYTGQIKGPWWLLHKYKTKTSVSTI